MRLILALTLAAAGCGTTYVVTTDPGARVFVDGQMVGKGQGTVNQRGLPGRAQVLVKTDDGRREQTTMSRSFTGTTFLLGLVTYGVCWVACWEYPGSVFVDVGGSRLQQASYNTPATAAQDPWLQPPPGWRPHGTPPPPGAPSQDPSSGD
jgi:hypothetical protein